MKLASPESAILSAGHIHALINRRADPAGPPGSEVPPDERRALLRRHLFIYGFGGLVAPFIGIKLIDMLMAAVGWA